MQSRLSIFENRRWMSLLIFAMAFILYANTLGHQYALDDDLITRGNRYVQEGFKGLPSIFSKGFLHGFNGSNDQSYRPIVLANMAIEVGIFGNNPGVHHFFNVLFFALCCCCIYWMMTLFFQQRQSLIPLLTALLFAAHPIHTEVVANIKSRDELLCLLFMLLAIISLFKHIQSNKKAWLPISICCFLIAVMAKEIGLALLAIIPVALYLFSEKSIKSIGGIGAIFGGATILYFILRMMVMDTITFDQEMDLINNSLVGAESTSSRIASTIAILGKYIGKLVFPHPLSFDYSYNQIPNVGFGHWSVWIAILLYLALFLGAIYSLLKKQLPSLAIVWFVSTLFLVSNVPTMVGASFAERFMFSPSLGFCMLVAFGSWQLMQKLGAKQVVRNSLLLCSLLLVIYSAKTIQRNAAWKNNVSLFETDIQTATNSARAHNHLASAYRIQAESNPKMIPTKRKQLLDKAIVHYQKALAIYSNYVEAGYNLGICYQQLGMIDKARKAYEDVIVYAPENDKALVNLGGIYYQQNQPLKALETFETVTKINPQSASAFANIGAVHYTLNNIPKAIANYTRALEIDPNNRNANLNMSRIYQSKGDQEKAAFYGKRVK